MAKARSRATARKIKDRWKAKNWYNIIAPPAFDNITVADTLSDDPEGLINRVTGVSLQDVTNDFRKSHITLFFQINKVEEDKALTQFTGHTLTSDYVRRMIRRRRSKIDGVYDVKTKDGANLRIKPFATTDKRIQNSQKRVIRESMKKTITDQSKNMTMYELIKFILDGKLGSEIYKSCKKIYPVKRVEISKTEVVQQPTIMMEETKPAKKKEETKKEDKETDKKEETKKEDKKTKKETVKEEKTDKPEKPEKKEKTKTEKQSKKEDKKEDKKTKKETVKEEKPKETKPAKKKEETKKEDKETDKKPEKEK